MTAPALPEPVAGAAQALQSFPSDWSLCGGWAVDGWVGRQTREHPDIDISVGHDAQRELVGFFGPDWLLNGHDEVDEDDEAPWTGRLLGHPAHVHARHEGGLHLDFQLDRRADGEWLLAADPPVTRPLADCVAVSAWGVPTVVPSVLLFYKGIGEIRPHDQADFGVLSPLLSTSARRWLADALRTLRPGHPWLEPLRRPASGR